MTESAKALDKHIDGGVFVNGRIRWGRASTFYKVLPPSTFGIDSPVDGVPEYDKFIIKRTVRIPELISIGYVNRRFIKLCKFFTVATQWGYFMPAVNFQEFGKRVMYISADFEDLKRAFIERYDKIKERLKAAYRDAANDSWISVSGSKSKPPYGYLRMYLDKKIASLPNKADIPELFYFKIAYTRPCFGIDMPVFAGLPNTRESFLDDLHRNVIDGRLDMFSSLVEKRDELAGYTGKSRSWLHKMLGILADGYQFAVFYGDHKLIELLEDMRRVAIAPEESLEKSQKLIEKIDVVTAYLAANEEYVIGVPRR